MVTATQLAPLPPPNERFHDITDAPTGPRYFDIPPPPRMVEGMPGGPDLFPRRKPRPKPIEENEVIDNGENELDFGTEAPGAGSGAKRPGSGRPADDILPVIQSFDWLTEAEKLDIFHNNAKKFFPLANRFPV